MDLEKALLNEAIAQIKKDFHDKIGTIRHPITGEFPTVIVRGDRLDDLSAQIEGSPELLALVEERCNSRASRLRQGKFRKRKARARSVRRIRSVLEAVESSGRCPRASSSNGQHSRFSGDVVGHFGATGMAGPQIKRGSQLSDAPASRRLHRRPELASIYCLPYHPQRFDAPIREESARLVTLAELAA